MEANPIHVGTGNKFQKESDYVGADGLKLERYYNSQVERVADYYQGLIPEHWGVNWRSTYERRIIENNYWITSITVLRDDGQQLYFNASGQFGPWAANDADINFVLTRLTSGSAQWSLRTPQDDVELYDSAGRLMSVTSRAGVVQTLTYSDGTTGSNGGFVLDATGIPTTTTLPAGLLIRVSSSFGRTLTLGYDSSQRVVKVGDPSGGTYLYVYDTYSNLVSVTSPATPSAPTGEVRAYLYSESANVPFTDTQYPHKNILTGVTDESGSRYATYQYDAAGRATQSAHALSAGATSISYTADSSGVILSSVSTDALGTARARTFASSAGVVRATSLSQPCSGGCSASNAYTYDTSGNVSSATDFNGNVTTYSYTTTRNLEASRTEAYGTARARTITTTWHSTYRLPLTITEPNRTTTYTYDSSGNQLTKTITDTSVTPNVSRTWTYTYDLFGHVLTADGPRSDVTDLTTFTYYSCTTGYECGQLHTITDALSHVTTYNTYNAQGQPLTITDPNGVVTTLTYDARQRLTSRTIGTESTTFEYWPTGLLKKVTLPDASYLTYTYDAAHRLTEIDDAAGNRMVYTLDAMGNRTGENLYDPSNALARTHARVFNSLNQLWKDVTASGSTSQQSVFGYDSNGNQTTITAPLSRNASNTYDELNRLTTTTDANSGLTTYGYDANDNLTSVQDPRTLTTTYSYSGFGDLKTQVSPDTGTTTNTFDAAGNLKTSQDARSKTGTYTYDALNRVTQLAYSDQTLTYTYDSGTNGTGRLTGASDANHSLGWSYDTQGRVTSKTQTVGSITKTIGYGYTSGQLTSMTLPSGQVITYSYTNGQVTGISVGSTTILNSVLYDPFGPARQWMWGNSTSAIRTYDADGKISQVDSAGLNTYGYDDAFRITGITDTTTSANSWTYGYDSLDRLTSAVNASITQGFTYDADGNRLTQTGTTAQTLTYPSTSNRLSSLSGSTSKTYTFDAAGHTTGDGTATYTYSDAGRMTSATVGSTTTSYVINALGQRVKKSNSSSTTYFVYDEAGHLIGEYDGSGTLLQELCFRNSCGSATHRLQRYVRTAAAVSISITSTPIT